jgi:hypothetical protein
MSERRKAFGLTVQRETSEEATGNIHQPPFLVPNNEKEKRKE